MTAISLGALSPRDALAQPPYAAIPYSAASGGASLAPQSPLADPYSASPQPQFAQASLAPNSASNTALGDPAVDTPWSNETLHPSGAAYGEALSADENHEAPWRVPPEQWSWRLLPRGLIYRSYLAGAREPRAGAEWNYVVGRGWVWDFTMGARIGLLRYGSGDAIRPQGWQLDIEGAALGRLAIDRNLDLEATDYRAGLPLTYGVGRYATKFAFYHLSSHVGDEFLLTHPGFTRLNYSRNVLVWGHSWSLTDNLRVYGEAGYAVENDGGSQPWEFQFGADYAPLYPTGFSGAPFLAFNSHLRQEVNFGGQFTMHAGWAWRDDGPGRLFRTGLMYFNGKHRQLSFPFAYEHQVGVGAWYDF